ncbi:MAG TPA: hypothetical protein VHY19_10440 [Steroidobacteraceae bacterium]|jgi:hypothetical protein|nr:hypothetical protein [Steroidobacteraceae bacterium]
MDKRKASAIAAALLITGLGMSGIAPATDRPAELSSLPGKEACFWMHSIFNWAVLDDSTLLVEAPTSQTPFLVKLFRPMPGMTTDRVGFDSGRPRAGLFCVNSYVFVRGPARAAPPDYAPAIAVRALTPVQAKELLAKAGGPVVYRQPEPQGPAASTGAGTGRQ